MIFFELVKTAWQSLKTNPKRSLLTMVGIVIGVSAVITIMSLGTGIKNKMLAQFHFTADGNMTAQINFYQNDGVSMGKQGFNDVDINLIKNHFAKDIQKVKIDHSDMGSGINLYGNLGNRNKLFSVGLVKGNSTKYDIVNGHNITNKDNTNGRPVALISKHLAQKDYGNSQHAIGTSIAISHQTYEIVGTFDHRQGNFLDSEVNVILPKTVFTSSDGAQKGDSLRIIFKKHRDVQTVAKKITSFLKKNGQSRHDGNYTFINIGKELRQIKIMFNALTYFISAIAAISLFIAGIGVMNMMYISVSERTQEIGIRLAMGAKPWNITQQFLLEAVMLTLSGGLIGFLFGWGLVNLISTLSPFKATVTLGSFLLAVGISSAVGIIFGILPARQAARKNLIDTLR